MLAGDLSHIGKFITQFFANRPLPGLGQYRTPISKLYMCGASTHSGGMITFGPGYCATEKIAEDLGIEKWWPEPQHVKLAKEAGLF